MTLSVLEKYMLVSAISQGRNGNYMGMTRMAFREKVPHGQDEIRINKADEKRSRIMARNIKNINQQAEQKCQTQ